MTISPVTGLALESIADLTRRRSALVLIRPQRSSRLTIGSATFEIRATLTNEPDKRSPGRDIDRGSLPKG